MVTRILKNKILICLVCSICLATSCSTLKTNDLQQVENHPIKKENTDNLAKLGISLEALGQYNEALEVFKRSLEVKFNARIYARVCNIRFLLTNYDESIDCYRNILNTENENIFVLNNLAWILITSDDSALIEEGIKTAKTALSLSKIKMPLARPYILDTIAWGFFKSGQFKKALKSTNKIVDTYGKDLFKDNPLIFGHYLTIKREIKKQY
ncbi:MAG: hypothetical protein HN600_16345 [Bacteroidetes bacterium]|jgi:tetratricopeptide (TPR) repeat protein|nr:hypothetical protein [Bacteroidota bacterium]